MGAGRGSWFQFLTALGVTRGFFVPYRHAGEVATPPHYKGLEKIFADALPQFAAWAARIDAYRAQLQNFGVEPPPAPRWNQDWFTGHDAAFVYTFVRETAPKRIVEIGSGHSTRFMARAIQDGGLSTKLDCIDPAPRATLTGLRVDWTKARLETTDYPFAELGEGDVVFVDSSHILMPGTDLDFLFANVLPALKRGVVLHFHDIFLPWAYPESWAWRGYNEQNAVAGMLASGAFDLLWSSSYAARHLRVTALNGLPIPDTAYVSSLWLRKRYL